jgi:hypothetical protein
MGAMQNLVPFQISEKRKKLIIQNQRTTLYDVPVYRGRSTLENGAKMFKSQVFTHLLEDPKLTKDAQVKQRLKDISTGRKHSADFNVSCNINLQITAPQQPREEAVRAKTAKRLNH